MVESAHLVLLLWAPTAEIAIITLLVWSVPLDGRAQLAAAVLQAIRGTIVHLALQATIPIQVCAVLALF